MKTEIGGTFEWSEEQIKAYAAAFHEGDAVKVDGEGWVEVKTHNAVWGEYLAVGDPDGAMLNAAGKGSCGAFLQSGGSCVVVTPKDYEAKEGDKLVWLGESGDSRTFGMSYAVASEESYFEYRDDDGHGRIIVVGDDLDWGVIPRYENLKEEEEMNEERECASGTFKWSDKAKAYAAAFREGDAVKVSGEWRKVKKYEGDGIQSDNFHAILNNYDTPVEYNPYCLNYDHDGKGNFAGVTNGFLESRVESPYEIVSPKDYRVKEGDKIVWLRGTVKQGCRSEFTFGKAYDVFRSDDGYLVYKNDMAIELLASYLKDKDGMWGVIPRYENVKEEEEMNSKCERSGNVGKFKKGDRVKVTGGSYKGSEGSVGQSDEVGGGLSYAVLFDDGRDRWFEEEFLGLVEGAEKSAEQEAFDYLLSQDKDATRSILQGEISIWASIHLEHKDYDDLRQATEILEKLEKGE